MAARRTNKCPICEKPAPRTGSHFPFCSARCKTIDLGAWAAEEYVVSRPLTEADENLSPSSGEEQRSGDE